IRPLIDLRARQMGLPNADKLLEKNVFVADSRPLLSETEALQWARNVYREEDKPVELRRSENALPQYLLVLGDLHEVPETIPRALTQLGCFVGRLAFSSE